VLARVKKASLSAYTHQNMPFDKLVETLAPDAGPERNPVVQVLLLVLAGHSHGQGEGLESEATPLFDGNSRWDLMFGLYDFEDLGFSGPVEFNADLFDRATVERWLALFRLILDRVVADPDVRLSRLPALEEVAAA
jgi:non-ribosomal peptide synthetase component F